MLIEVTRHGFTFLEARPSMAPILEDLPDAEADRIYQDQGKISAQRRAEQKARGIEKRIEREMKRKEKLEKIPQSSAPKNLPPDIAEIQRAAMEVFGVKPGHFYGPSKREPIGACRGASMTLCRDHTPHILERIAAAHYRETSLVGHAMKRFRDQMETNPEYRAKIEAIKARLISTNERIAA